MDIPAMKERDGYIGLVDFPGQLIALFQKIGFIYHSRVAIWKDPLVEATRTKAIGLMHKQIIKDSAMCRNGLPDYLITFRKPGNNPEPVAHPDGFTSYIGDGDIPGDKKKRDPVDTESKEYASHRIYNTDPVYSHQVWRRYASPVWMDINQTDTLQYRSARDTKDERHICPLQLGVIRRAIELWTNKNDIILSPFGGIGSEPVTALKMGRRAIAIELKDSYYKQMKANCAATKTKSANLFSDEEGN
jgi:DNA modification methylase